MNISKLSKELIIAIRGRLSKGEFAKLLGVNIVQIGRWESNKVYLKWNDFVLMTHSRNISLKKILESFLESPVRDLSQSEIVQALKGLHSNSEFSKLVGVSTRTFERWESGKTNITLEDMLRIIYKSTNFLPEFVDKIVAGKGLPTFRKELDVRERERQFHYKYPDFSAVVRALEIKHIEEQTQASVKLLAQYSGVPETRVKALIKSAVKLGILKQEGQRFRPVNKSLGIKGDYFGKLNLIQHWNQLALNIVNSLLQHRGDSQSFVKGFSYLLFTTNSVTEQKIQKLNMQYKVSLLNLLHHDDNRSGSAPLDRVMLMQHNLINLKTY